MSCELTPDLKRSPAYNAHAASKRPNTKLLFKRSFRTGSLVDRSRNCIEHLHKADLKNNVLIVMLILCHKNGKESSSECVVASCFKSL